MLEVFTLFLVFYKSGEHKLSKHNISMHYNVVEFLMGENLCLGNFAMQFPYKCEQGLIFLHGKLSEQRMIAKNAKLLPMQNLTFFST